jgi:release factor glutamine methyltransferase
MTVDAACQSEVVARLRAAGCVFAEEEARLLIAAARTPAELTALTNRRVSGLPLEQVVGWAEFCGRRVVVDVGVFVPRPRTELLVREAIALGRPGAVVVDLCCGSGAVGAAVAAGLGAAALYAVDIDPAAVRCARRNLGPLGGHVLEGDLYDPLPAAVRGRVDVVVANAPYVPTEAIRLLPREARAYEPRASLDGGRDGLDIQRRIIAAAAGWLRAGGHLLLETSERQAPQTVEIVEGRGLTARTAQCDELDATVVIGAKPGAHSGDAPADA